MNPGTRHLRLGMLGIVGLTMLATLLARLWFLQMTESDSFQVEAQANRIRTVTLPAPRGRILDVNGRILVDNRQSIVVTIDRRLLADLDPGMSGGLLDRLAAELTRFGVLTDRDFLDRRLSDDRFDRLLPVPVAEDVSEEFEIFLRERQDEFPAVSVDRVWVRTYPFGHVAAHILGVLGPITEDELADADEGYRAGDDIGKSGIERIFEADLRGRPGVQVIEVDAKDDPIGVLDEQSRAARQGDDVRLTIDIDLQARAQKLLEQSMADARRREPEDPEDPEFRAPGGAVVVLDSTEDHVLAMASAPTYDPEIFVNGVSTTDWNRLNAKTSNDPLVGRATEGLYAPGSTFKPFVAYAAVTAGLIDPETTTFTDVGSYRLSDCTGGTCLFRNAGSVAYGQVDLRRALTVSSDAFFYWLGEGFWNERTTGREFGDPMAEGAKAFGMGQPSGVQLPNERSGFIPDPETSKARFEENPEAFPFGGEWYAGNNVITAIGQGDVLVTPLQLANAYATLANGGQLRSPSIVADVREAGTEVVVRSFSPRNLSRVKLPPRVRSPIVEGLIGVTAAPEGTADHVFAGFPLDRWPVAGKTGTAEVAGKADTSLFAGFGPADDPEFVVVALIEEAGFGSQAAAPLARQLFDVLSGSDDLEPARSVEESLDIFLQPPALRVPGDGNEVALTEVRDAEPTSGLSDSGESSTSPLTPSVAGPDAPSPPVSAPTTSTTVSPTARQTTTTTTTTTTATTSSQSSTTTRPAGAGPTASSVNQQGSGSTTTVQILRPADADAGGGG